jgi:hypothetical protein
MKDDKQSCKAGRKFEGVLEFTIPKDETDLPPDGRQQRLLEQDFPVSVNLTNSCHFKLYQV